MNKDDPSDAPRRPSGTALGLVILLGFASAFAIGFGFPPGIAAPPPPAAAEPAPRKTVVILGDSLAAGFGVDAAEAFPALLQQEIQSAGLEFEIVNAGVSGDTTAGGLRRLGWLLRRPIDVLLVELGGNDGLRGIPPDATRSNLVAIIRTARTRQPRTRILLAGLQMPPNMGDDYVRQFRDLFPRVAREEQTGLIPHLLEGVGGRPELNLPDLIHPTPEGHRLVASNVWQVLHPLLLDVAGRSTGSREKSAAP